MAKANTVNEAWFTVQRFTVPGLPGSAEQATPERDAQARVLCPGESDFGRKPNREPLNREPLNHA